jgi:hypothetical protein
MRDAFFDAALRARHKRQSSGLSGRCVIAPGCQGAILVRTGQTTESRYIRGKDSG